MWLFEFMYNSYSMWSLRGVVNHLGIAVGELVGSHHSHLGPVRKVDVVLKQTDTKWVWNDSTSMHHGFSKNKQTNENNNNNVENVRYFRFSLITFTT